jgi:hypothetical protein
VKLEDEFYIAQMQRAIPQMSREDLEQYAIQLLQFSFSQKAFMLQEVGKAWGIKQ